MSDRQRGAGLTADGPPRSLLIVAIVVAAAAAAVVLGIAVASRHHDQPPVTIPAVPAPQAASPECATLLSVLPPQLGDYPRAIPAGQPPAGTAAWQKKGIDEPVVLRCGLDRPADFVVGTSVQVINDVQWFRASEGGRVTWFAVDRPVYVALTLPQDSGPTPIQQMSEAVAQALPAVPIRPGPPR